MTHEFNRKAALDYVTRIEAAEAAIAETYAEITQRHGVGERNMVSEIVAFRKTYREAAEEANALLAAADLTEEDIERMNAA